MKIYYSETSYYSYKISDKDMEEMELEGIDLEDPDDILEWLADSGVDLYHADNCRNTEVQEEPSIDQ